MNFNSLLYKISYWLIYLYQQIIKLFDYFLPNIRSIIIHDKFKQEKKNIIFYYILYIFYKLNLYDKLISNDLNKSKTYIVDIKYKNVYKKIIYNSELRDIFHLSNSCSFMFKNNITRRPIKSITIKNKNEEITDITNIKYFWSSYSDETCFGIMLYVYGIDTENIQNITINTLRKSKDINGIDLYNTKFGDIFI
mgnify:CR=1 FL=1|jgi:hypothetical protein